MNPIIPAEYLSLLIVAFVAVGTVLAWLSSHRCRTRRRVAMCVLRGLALLGLGVVALNPGYWKHSRDVTEGEWVLMLDRSASMATADENGDSRWARGVELGGRARKLAEDPELVRVCTFADDLRMTTMDDARDVVPDGGMSDITGAGSRLIDQYQSLGRRLTGILLVSDGRQLPGRPAEPFVRRALSREVRLFALPVGGDVPRRDVRLELVRRRGVGFVGQSAPIRVRVHRVGTGAMRAKVELVDDEGNVLDTQLTESQGDGSDVVTLSVVANETGYSEYTVRVAAIPDERDTRNNQVRAGLSVLSDPIRVLVVEGVPHWDSKFLVQLLRAQPNTRVSSVYRLSADRYFFVGADSSDVADSKLPVFPDTPAELARYDIVVFGKGAEYFLTPARVKLLREFVRDQGGGVLFARGKPYAGTFPELEVLEPVTWGNTGAEAVALQPTEAGEEAGLFADLLPARGDPIWQTMPAFRVMHRCESISSFAQVLATGAGAAGPEAGHPILISRRYGRGLVLAMNAGDLWRWDFFPSVSGAASLYESLWTQLVQWMATFGEFLPGQDYALTLSASAVSPGESIRATVAARESNRDGGAPVVVLERGGERVATYPGVEPPDGSRRWEVLFSVAEPGDYRVAAASAETGAAVTPTIPLHVAPAPEEGDELSADAAFLQGLAEGTGGRLLDESSLADAVRELEPQEEVTDVEKATWQQAWNRWWMLLVIAALLGGEWFLRRRGGLL